MATEFSSKGASLPCQVNRGQFGIAHKTYNCFAHLTSTNDVRRVLTTLYIDIMLHPLIQYSQRKDDRTSANDFHATHRSPPKHII